MAQTVELGPQVPIGVRIGYAKAPNAKMVVMSLTSGTITVSCNGSDYPVVPTANDALDVTVGISSWLGNTATVLFADRIAQINAAMAELDASGSYTVQTVDLSGFTNYA